MIILTLFGTTVGLKVLHLPLAQAPSTVKLEDAWIAITGSQMTVRPDKDSYVVLRKTVGPHLATWIGLYRPAREIGYDRSGGFYGAGAWLIDSLVDANLLMQVIRNLADQIRSVAMDGDRFTKCILDCRASFVQPPQTSEMISTLSRPSAGCNPTGGTAFVVGGANPLEVIDWAQGGMSASVFSKIIVGAPEHAPAGGSPSSTQFFRSLPLAIEGVYKRVSLELTNARSTADQAQVQVHKFQAENHSLQVQTQQLEEKSNRLADLNQQLSEINNKAEYRLHKLEDEIRSLKRGSSFPAPGHPHSPAPGSSRNNGRPEPKDQAKEFGSILWLIVIPAVVLVLLAAVLFVSKPEYSWCRPLCKASTAPAERPKSTSGGSAIEAGQSATKSSDSQKDPDAPTPAPAEASVTSANVIQKKSSGKAQPSDAKASVPPQQ